MDKEQRRLSNIANRKLKTEPKEHGPVTGKAPKKMTKEEISTHQDRMEKFRQRASKNRGLSQKFFSNPDNLTKAIDEYLIAIKDIGLFPTEGGLMIFLDVSASWYNGVIASGDERAEVLLKFRDFASEYVNQSGLVGETNTIFSIYYLKSKMGQYDTPDSHTININVNDNMPMFERRCTNGHQLKELISSTPIEIDDFQEIKEKQAETTETTE